MENTENSGEESPEQEKDLGWLRQPIVSVL